MKLEYNEPKIYTGGVPVSEWSKLSKEKKKEALSKDWYVYYSFRHPDTGNLTMQTPIKASANIQKSKTGRMNVLKKVQRQLLVVLEAGFNPYKKDNSDVYSRLFGGEKLSEVGEDQEPKTGTFKVKKLETKVEQIKPKEEPIVTEHVMTLSEALQLVMETKERVLSKTSLPKFRSKVNRFYKWLLENGFKEEDSILKVNKKTVIQYLNSVLQTSSARNRNNSRIDISSFFQVLVDNDVLQDNFVKQINVLSSKPIRHKTYTSTQLEKIDRVLTEEDPILQLFIKFISYNLLRPIEVCRLRISDIDLKDRRLHVKAKNKPVKIKIIPDILMSELKMLKGKDPDHFVFTPTAIGGEWDTAETDKRDYFTKRFKKVKDKLGLGIEYTMYSFRHTYITKMYQGLVKDMSPNEAKSKLMLITGHATMDALEMYLRDIDAQQPEDYSHLLKSK